MNNCGHLNNFKYEQIVLLHLASPTTSLKDYAGVYLMIWLDLMHAGQPQGHGENIITASPPALLLRL